MPKAIEIAFRWTCPDCGHRQTDTVNPELGPFGSVTCEPCGKVFDDSQLSQEDRESFHSAGDRAIERAGYRD